MGICVITLGRQAAETIPDRLRNAGFEVSVDQTNPNSDFPDFILTRITCGKGKESQYVEWFEDPETPGSCHVHVVNAWAWRKRVYEKRLEFQRSVMKIIESVNGELPA